MTNEQKIKAYLAAGHHVKTTSESGDVYIIYAMQDDFLVVYAETGDYVTTLPFSSFSGDTIEPLPLTPPPYKAGDRIIILDVAREVPNYAEWDDKKKDMIGKVFTIDSVDYAINVGWSYSFPYFAVAPYFDDEEEEAKQTKIQELETQLSKIAKELELLKK